MKDIYRLILSFVLATLSAYPATYIAGALISPENLKIGIELHGIFGFGLNKYLFGAIIVSMIILALPTYITLRLINIHYSYILAIFGPLYGALIVYIVPGQYTIQGLIQGAIIGMIVSVTAVTFAPTRKFNK